MVSYKKEFIKKCDDAKFSNDDKVFSNEDYGNVTFSCVKMGILSVDLNNINLDDINFDEDDP